VWSGTWSCAGLDRPGPEMSATLSHPRHRGHRPA
jgi:hypothetical protein